MFAIYLLIFWIPAIAAGVLLWLCWSDLNRPVLTATFCVAALILQIWGQVFSPLWTIGLVAQTILAISLAIRMKLNL